MKSYMVLISFMGLFICSFNIAAMGGPGATYLPFDLEEENVTATADPGATYLSFDLDEDFLEKGIASLPQELQEVVIIKTLDSMLKEQLPREQADLNAFVSRFVQLLPNPLLSLRNRKYFLNRLAHKFFLTFDRHLRVPDWYLIKYFGEPGKEWYFKQIWTLRKDILDYSFSLLELIKHNKFNRKIENGRLDLSNLRLKNLEGLLKIPNIKTVTKLFLHNNQLKEFPKEIANLHNLRRLDLHYNQLKEFPKEIGNLHNLQRLYLNNNQLKEFPKEIANLHNLRALWLSSNQLKELPKEITNLHNLQVLELRNNQYLKKQEASIRSMLPKVTITF